MMLTLVMEAVSLIKFCLLQTMAEFIEITKKNSYVLSKIIEKI